MVIAFVVNKTIRTIVSNKFTYCLTTKIRLQDTSSGLFILRDNTQDILV